MTLLNNTTRASRVIGLAVAASFIGLAHADQVILDDLIVDGSICAGFDCVNGESFGFDTLRLKENNLRIRFQDTSNSASFPSNDWQLTANDTSNGGQNKFSIDDIDGGRTPFTIEAGAPSHSLYVDDGGRVGFGTSTPVVHLHVKDGNTPTLRLEQDGSSGFTPQTWDVAGNETNFFIRDSSNGSRLPFRIKPSAPSNSIFVDTDGDIGFGTDSPSDDGSSSRLVETKSTWGSVRLSIDQKGGSGKYGELLFQADNANKWSVGQDNSQFYIYDYVNGRYVMTANEATGNVTFPGNVTVSGTFTNVSDRNLKENFQAVNGEGLLQKLASLPILKWNFKADSGKVPHIGPMAQDFYEIFQVGNSPTGIFSVDLAGVTLASVQAINAKLESKDAEIATLKARLERLEQLVSGLDNRMAGMDMRVSLD